MSDFISFSGMRLEQKKRLLSQVDEAITAILNGAQEYTIGAKHIVRADLQKLVKLQESLEDTILSAEGDGPTMGRTTVAYFDRR